MNKINVIGTSGSGKSHFSRRLAKKLNIPHIELDTIFWQPNWQGLETDIFVSIIREALYQDTWVLDGNYSKTNSVKWQSVDTIIWLDYSFSRTLKQVLSRSIKRSLSKQEIWKGTGNIESFRRTFLSSESVVLWMLSNYWKTKKKYTKLFASDSLKEVQLIRLTSPKQAELFLTNAQST